MQQASSTESVDQYRDTPLAGLRRRAIDSTILDDAVARQDTVTQLIAQIRRVARKIPGTRELIAGLPGHDYSRPGKPEIPWDDAAARDELVSRLVGDALTGLEHATVLELTDGQRETLALLALVAGQDVEPTEGSDGTDGRWRIARRVASDRVISTVDPEARHAHKTREKRQDGFKAHLVVEPDTGLVTATALTKAAGAENTDPARGARLLENDPSIGDQPVEVLADSAYASGEMLAGLQAAGHAPLIKPMPLNRAVPGGFTIDDFIVDHDAATVTCPAGTTRQLSPKNRTNFGAACASCPLRTRCTTAARGRTIELTEHDRIKREHRARAQEPAFQAIYRQHRPVVERSIAWMTRGARRVPYRGVVSNDAWWSIRAAGINLKRLLNLGLTQRNGAWALG